MCMQRGPSRHGLPKRWCLPSAWFTTPDWLARSTPLSMREALTELLVLEFACPLVVTLGPLAVIYTALEFATSVFAPFIFVVTFARWVNTFSHGVVCETQFSVTKVLFLNLVRFS